MINILGADLATFSPRETNYVKKTSNKMQKLQKEKKSTAAHKPLKSFSRKNRNVSMKSALFWTSHFEIRLQPRKYAR